MKNPVNYNAQFPILPVSICALVFFVQPAPVFTIFNTVYTTISGGRNEVVSTPSEAISADNPVDTFVSDTSANTISTPIAQTLPRVPCLDKVVIYLDDKGFATIQPPSLMQGNYHYDDCTVDVFQGKSLGNRVDCSSIGHSLVFKVTDMHTGNGCWGNLRVEDTLPPHIYCEPILLPDTVQDFSPDNLLHEMGIPTGYPASFDNCGANTLTYTDETTALVELLYKGAPVPVTINSRVWHTNDASWNATSCTQTICLVPQLLLEHAFSSDLIRHVKNTLTDTGSADAGSLLPDAMNKK